MEWTYGGEEKVEEEEEEEEEEEGEAVGQAEEEFGMRLRVRWHERDTTPDKVLHGSTTCFFLLGCIHDPWTTRLPE